MKVYIHEGRGHYVGSYVVVIAENFQRASQMIRVKLDLMGLEKEALNVDEHEIVGETILLAVNGDY